MAAQGSEIEPFGLHIHRDAVASDLDKDGLAVFSRDRQIATVDRDRNVLGYCRAITVQQPSCKAAVHVDDDDGSMRTIAPRPDVLVRNVEFSVLLVDDDVLRLRTRTRQRLGHVIYPLELVGPRVPPN